MAGCHFRCESYQHGQKEAEAERESEGDECLSDEFLATLPKNYKFIHGSITGADLVGYTPKTERIDTIMHFAAQSHVDNSFGNSIDFSKTNILGTHVLLEAARLRGIKPYIGWQITLEDERLIKIKVWLVKCSINSFGAKHV